MAFKIKEMFKKDKADEDYLEVDLEQGKENKDKIKVRPFVLRKFDDITEILNSLREGYTIAIIDIKPLKAKDIIELKRAIAKIKKTIEALEGSIAGFGENTILATPSFAEVYKAPQAKEEKKDPLFY